MRASTADRAVSSVSTAGNTAPPFIRHVRSAAEFSRMHEASHQAMRVKSIPVLSTWEWGERNTDQQASAREALDRLSRCAHSCRRHRRGALARSASNDRGACSRDRNQTPVHQRRSPAGINVKLAMPPILSTAVLHSALRKQAA